MFDTMVFTKTLGALCGALLIFLLGKWVADELYQPGSRDLAQAYVIDIAEDEVEEAEVAEMTLDDAMAVADAGAGETQWNQCRACHSLEDGRNMVGPHLYNAVGREVGTVEGFNYSGALPEGETWTLDNLSALIANPREFAPGTSMAYPGMPDLQNRANLIAYMIEHSPDFDYVPPEAPAEEAPVEEAPAEEAAVEDESPIRAAYAAADPEVGQGLWRQCMACHVADDEANRVGPHLYGVVGREIGAIDDFRYSGNLPEGTWTLEELDAFIEDPRAYAPGTTMAMAGIGDVQDRAHLIAYIESVGPGNGVVEDAAPAEEAPAEEAPAEEEATEEAATEEAATDDAAESPIAAAFAQADVEAGATTWRQCMACHVADAESNRVGPHLVGIVGREIGAIEGFRYSGNLPEGTWTLEELDAFIEDPRTYAPGTTMAMAGIRELQDRANVIAYIESVSP